MRLVFGLAVAMSVILLSSLSAQASSNEIRGFIFHSCEANRCIEVKAERAWLSQGDGSFVTDGKTSLSVFDDGKVKSTYVGLEAIAQPQLDTITLEQDNGVPLVNLKDGQAEEFGRGVN